MMRSLICLLVLFASSYCEEEETASVKDSVNAEARLLLSKQIQNKYLVEGMDIVVKYGLYNVGETAAVDVKLKETGFPDESFDIVGGRTDIIVDRIPPRSNNTHTLIVRPKKFGYFNFTSAYVTYKVDENDEDSVVQVGYTSNPGHGVILSLKNYDRQFSAHILDWAAFAIITLPSLGVPFMMWYSSKSKYEALTRGSKKA